MNPNILTKEEFLKAVQLTKLADRTVAGCECVLVQGLSNVKAGEVVGVLPEQISRGLKLIRARHAELQTLQQEAENKLKEKKESIKADVVQAARGIAFENMTISDAEPGNEYTGRVILKDQGFLVQRMARHGIIHDLGKMSKVPKIDSFVSISYPAEKGLATVVAADEIEKDSKKMNSKANEIGKPGVER